MTAVLESPTKTQRRFVDSSGEPTGAYMNRQGNLYNNPWKMRVGLANNQSITNAGANKVVKFDAVKVDTANGWDPTTWTYTVQMTGYYYVSLCITWLPAGGIHWFVANGQANDSVTLGNFLSANVVNGSYPAGAGILLTAYTLAVADLVQLNAGALIQGQVTQQNDLATAQLIQGHEATTFLAMHLVSA